MEWVSLSQKFSLFTCHWDPKIVGELNGHHVTFSTSITSGRCAVRFRTQRHVG